MTKKKYLDRSQSEKVFKEGFVECDFWEIVGYSRYAYHSEGWSKGKILRTVKEKLSEKGLNIILLRNTIHDAVNGYKYDFFENNKVEITVPEMDKIKQINIRDYQRAIFGILVLSKHKGTQQGEKIFFSGDLKDLIRKSGTYFTDKQFKEFLYFSKKYGFISSFIKKKKNSVFLVWIITFAQIGKIYRVIDNFEKVQQYLPNYCILCKKEIIRGKYCKEHRGRRKKEHPAHLKERE